MNTDTPITETEMMWGAFVAGDADEADLANMLTRLERERDEARREAERWRNHACDRGAPYLHVKLPWETLTK